MKFAYLIEPPFNHRDGDGRVSGCDVDLARMVFRRLGLTEVEFVETEFAQLLPGLAAGRWDMTTGLFDTEERRRVASFSRPIWALPDGLLIRSDGGARPSGYADLARTGGGVLAVVRDQVQHRTALDAGVPGDRIRVFETYEEAAEAVVDGRAAAYASVARAHAGFIERRGERPLGVVTLARAEGPPAFGSFAFRRDDDDVRLAVDGALDAVLGTPEHRAMMAAYGFDDAEVDAVIEGP